MRERTTAVVTGAGSGIGHAIASRLAHDGYCVWLVDRDGDTAAHAAARIRESGGEAHHAVADVTRADTLRSALHEILDTDGRVDVLAANAGVSSMRPFLELTENDWQHNIDVNAKGAFLTLQTFGARMIEQERPANREVRGKIVVTASMAARQGAPFLAHYSASKFAVTGLVHAVAREFAEHAVPVNAVNPGWVQTSMQEREVRWEAELRGMTPDAVKSEYVRNTPLKRLQRPEDIAAVVSFLAGPDSDFLTGESIEANGGAFIY